MDREYLENYDYASDVIIDKDALDDEWINQPSLFMRYAEAQAESKMELDRAHEAVKVARSEIIRELKNDYPKMTEKVIEAHYRTDERHLDAKEAMIEAEYVYNMLNAAVMAMHQRKMALENLVRLQGQEYFSTPTPKGTEKEKEVVREQMDEKRRTAAKKRVKSRRRT